MRALGLRGRVILGFAAGALLLSVTVTLVTDVVSARYLVDQRERAASRQAVVNGLFVESRLTRDGADPSGALGAVRLGTGAEAVLVAPDASASTAIGLGTEDLPAGLVTATEAGQPSVQRYRFGGTPVVAIGVPLQGGYAYYEVTELENLDTTLQTIIWAGVGAALLTSLLGAALGWWAASRVLRPLNHVAQAATKLAAGDLDARAPTTTDPDLTAISSSFNAMADTLATRIQRDAQFAADVSHELRSPLTTMTASASVLEARRAELPDVAREAVDLLVVDIARFAELLEDLLDLARDHEPLDLESQPVVDLADLASIELEGRQQVLVPRGDTRVRADSRRLGRVIANLVQNADAHGGGVERVTVERVGDAVRMSVADAGPGVPPEDREAVFDRFSRGTSTPSRASSGGTGLGLALVRDHVLAHGGACWYEDADSGGACFVVEIPGASP
ncbi:MAG: HAMP domain-containing histidine kinase [Actinomycetia bacterium]|nr:HAMP domain-containing histidine kinase [Actinomycetes bacterium]